nr:glycoside hydrolase family 16 protein [Mycobacterium sp. 141]
MVASSMLLIGCMLPSIVSWADPDPQESILFSDDFDGPAGTLPGPAWHIDTGGGGWGNNEAQIYTADPSTVGLDGAGHLAITARRDGNRIVSGRLTTAPSFAFTTGRAAARIALPAGTGVHPAFWLLGANINAVGWPAAGEIDVIETLNDASEYHTGVHAPDGGSVRGQEISATGPAPFPLAGQFHTYWVDRTPERIVTGVDNVTLAIITPFNLKPGATWVFDAPFYLLLNLAIGGDWPGSADDTTFPTTMLVDWVRVTTR